MVGGLSPTTETLPLSRKFFAENIIVPKVRSTAFGNLGARRKYPISPQHIDLT
jgi:hypothetical protein